jgi:hypothetical protein
MIYELTENGVTRLADGASIPNANGNRDWREFQEWLSEGGVPRPMKPSSFHAWDEATEVWVEDTVASQAATNASDIDKLEKVDRAVLRLLMSLITKLIDNGTIAGTDFSATERDLYQRVKALKGTIYG